jgi:hypothetical protein
MLEIQISSFIHFKDTGSKTKAAAKYQRAPNPRKKIERIDRYRVFWLALGILLLISFLLWRKYGRKSDIPAYD